MTAQEHANAIWRAGASPEALAGAISAYTDELRGELHRVTAENTALKEGRERCHILLTEGVIKLEEVRSERDTARARIVELEGAIQGFREHMVAAVTVGEIDKEEREYIIGILDGCVAISTQAPSK